MELSQSARLLIDDWLARDSEESRVLNKTVRPLARQILQAGIDSRFPLYFRE
jgi:hypothetical protein